MRKCLDCPTWLRPLRIWIVASPRSSGRITIPPSPLKWMVTKLGRIQAVQDEHTLRLDRLETKVDAMPRVVAELLRETEDKMALMEDRLLKAIQGSR